MKNSFFILSMFYFILKRFFLKKVSFIL